MKLWKVLGVAGVAGVAATGVAVARAERRRNAYEPADVRARLHERHLEATRTEAAPEAESPSADGPERSRLRTPWTVLRRPFGRRSSP